MLTIGLKEVKFRAYHGVYAHEQVTGGDFILNLSVEYNPGKRNVLQNLDETLNYEVLFLMARELMEKPVGLLEQVVMELTSNIFSKFNGVEQVSIQLEKCHPPIEHLTGSVFVKYDISRNDFFAKGLT